MRIIDTVPITGANAFGVTADVGTMRGNRVSLVPITLDDLEHFEQRGDHKVKYDQIGYYQLSMPPDLAKKHMKDGLVIRTYFTFDFKEFNIEKSLYTKDALIDSPSEVSIDEVLVGVRLGGVNIYSKDMHLLAQLTY